MKKLLYITLSMVVALVAMTSCEEEAAKPMVDLSGENVASPVISNAATGTGALSMETSGDVFETFEWSAVEYDAAVAITYSLKMDVSEDFSSALTLVSTEGLTASPTVKQINDGAIALGAETGADLMLYFTVTSTINGVDESMLMGTEITRTVVPFDVIIDYPVIYVPGEFQGWSPGADNGRLYSYDFNSVYQGILRLTNDYDPADICAFKVTDAPNWDNGNFGGVLTAAGSGYTGTLSASDGDMMAALGTYAFTVDLDAMTIVLEKTEDWGIIGSGIAPYDWSADVDMNYNGQQRIWELTTDLVAGEIKFRADDDWALNYGDTGVDGVLDAGGDNIAIAEDGNYTIQLDVENLSYKVTKN